MIELYTWGTPNGHKANIMLEETGLPYELHPIDISKGDQKSERYLAINPNGKIPAIVDKDGPTPIQIFESGAILLHLADKSGKFLPKDPQAKASAIAWTFWQVGGLGPMLGQWGYFMRSEEKIPSAIDRYRQESLRLIGVLDKQLEGSDYIVGEYGIADIACFSWTRMGLERLDQEDVRKDRFSNVRRWLERVGARPAVQKGLALVGKK